jgi:hypothetical protein
MSITKIGTDKTQWYAVFSDQQTKEYKNKEDALNANGIFVIEDIFKNYDKVDYWWKLSNFRFYDNNGNLIQLSEGNWKIVEINEIQRRSSILEVEFTFEDPQKVIQVHKFSRNASGRARFCKIFEAIEYIKQRSTFSSWKEYKLFLENQQLKDEILLLKDQIQNLNSNKE